jgi:hypothetical protein
MGAAVYGRPLRKVAGSMPVAYRLMREEDLLRAVFARVAQRGAEANVQFITAGQQWAVEVCVEARLELEADCGCVFTRGEVGPLRPYLPSGAYL